MKKQLHIFVAMIILWGSQVVVASDFSYVFEAWEKISLYMEKKI